jgi:hypothetical protein
LHRRCGFYLASDPGTASRRLDGSLQDKWLPIRRKAGWKLHTLAEEIQRQGIYATVHNYAEWQTLADRAAVAYRARREGPIIIIGHSLGADAVMEMSAYLGRRGVPVALAVPFDAKQSYATPSNVGRLLNLTHAGYGYMSRGVGFQGSLSNVDVSRTPASTT